MSSPLDFVVTWTPEQIEEFRRAMNPSPYVMGWVTPPRVKPLGIGATTDEKIAWALAQGTDQSVPWYRARRAVWRAPSIMRGGEKRTALQRIMRWRRR